MYEEIQDKVWVIFGAPWRLLYKMWEETETLGGPGELTQTEVGLMTIGRALCSSAILLYRVAKVMEASERILKDTGSNL